MLQRDIPIPVQNVAILEHLKRGPITPIEALVRHRCFRLAARIWDLRQIGHVIYTGTVINSYGNPYAEYHLIKLAQPKQQETTE